MVTFAQKKKKKKLWIQVRTNNSIHLRFLTKLLWKLCECNIFLNFKKFSNLRKLLFTRDVFYIWILLIWSVDHFELKLINITIRYESIICILLIWSVDHFELKLINITMRYESIRWEATKDLELFYFYFYFLYRTKDWELESTLYTPTWFFHH